ncbi:MAG TPA: ribosome biogenesis GTPase Der, partial [Hyphomicrobiales bacterium]|nr:ribosome biogenesis GTPase Der [Hyphomicrobiales bacterium]
MSYTVAIVGRPNVGKSTLFNRLVGKRLALVDDTPGVTRDRREGEARLGPLTFRIIDTAGLEEAEAESLTGRMRAQTVAAIADADLTLFLIDARAGVTPVDAHFADLIRRSDKRVLLVANKAEGRPGEAGYYDAFSLGFGEPIPISAEHGEGLADLAIAIEQDMLEAGIADDDEDEAEDRDRPVSIAIVGRPNVGKSTLVNRLIGVERLLTGPEAGITRDSITIEWEWRGRRVRLVDTAGMRKKARVQEKLEKLSVADALRAIRFAEVVVLTLDASIPFEKQDLQIADLVEKEGRAIVVALDKWDVIEDRGETLKTLREEAERLLPQLRGLTIVPVSGLTGEGLDKLMAAIFSTH